MHLRNDHETESRISSNRVLIPPFLLIDCILSRTLKTFRPMDKDNIFFLFSQKQKSPGQQIRRIIPTQQKVIIKENSTMQGQCVSWSSLVCVYTQSLDTRHQKDNGKAKPQEARVHVKPCGTSHDSCNEAATESIKCYTPLSGTTRNSIKECVSSAGITWNLIKPRIASPLGRL